MGYELWIVDISKAYDRTTRRSRYEWLLYFSDTYTCVHVVSGLALGRFMVRKNNNVTNIKLVCEVSHPDSILQNYPWIFLCSFKKY